ncbi:unnamed protein product [Penicillium pancosmium]
MEPPTKRPRFSVTSDPPEEEVSDDWDLQTARAQNDMKLKSIFEDIFAKYGQDFTEVGDEIDLETGDIVVDNGHLLGLEEEGRNDQSQAWHAKEDEDPESENEKEPVGSPHDPDNLVFEDPGAHSDDLFKFTRPKSKGLIPDEGHSYPRASALTSTSDNPQAWQVPEELDAKPPPEELGPIDPVWKVPELPRCFLTPRTETRFAKVPFTPRLPTVDRKSSPPGSRSLWSVPRQRRPRTEGKPRATPSKARPRAKRKYHSSPVALEALDWSFADIAEEGDESDDPLQEYQPSPTPSNAANIRRKRMRITAHDNSNQEIRFELNPELLTPAEPTPHDQSATDTHLDAKHSHVEQGDARVTVTNSIDVQCDSPALPTTTHGAAPASSPVPVSIPVSIPVPAALSSDPISPRSRTIMTPDEMRLVLRKRHVEGKRWKEILPFLPKSSLDKLKQWNSNHWFAVRAKPSPLRAPWSQSELETFDRLQDRPFLAWKDFQVQLPDRSKAEIEFELMRRWVGDEVWNRDGSSSLPQLKNDGGGLERNCVNPQFRASEHDGLETDVRDREASVTRLDTPSTRQTPPVTHLDTPSARQTPAFPNPDSPSATQTPTVYLISDGEDEDDGEDQMDTEDLGTLSDEAEAHMEEVSADPSLPDSYTSRLGARPVKEQIKHVSPPID